MDCKKALERKLKSILKKVSETDVIIMEYDRNEVIGTYECYGMYEPDCKTPMEWLNGNLVFFVTLAGKDISKVSLKLK